MNNIFKDELEGDADCTIYHKDSFEIASTLNIADENLLYFKVHTSDFSPECCRISLTEPKILDESDYKLSDDQIKKVIDILKSHNDRYNMSNWDYLILSSNDERAIEELPLIDDDIIMHDYSKLIKVK